MAGIGKVVEVKNHNILVGDVQYFEIKGSKQLLKHSLPLLLTSLCVIHTDMGPFMENTLWLVS